MKRFRGFLIALCTLQIELCNAASITPASQIAGGGAAGANAGGGGIAIKKADAVVEQKQDAMGSLNASSLIGTAVNLFAGFQALKQSTTALDANCAPTQAELDFVNKMVKEYAKTGKESQAVMFASINKDVGYQEHCDFATNVGVDGLPQCAGHLDDKDKIWNLYPKAEMKKKCPPANPQCVAKEEKYYSNIYDIYGEMAWSESDMLPDELSAHSKLMAKAEQCSPAAIKKKKAELTGNLITGTMGSIGKQQNSGDVMGAVSGLMQSSSASGGGIMGGVSGLGSMGMSMMPMLMGGK
ncbi:MAG: hypothetical protein LBL46_01540 [Rickettsiales bacterium]|jgi:myosin heavy subunit|nr:hypothetical protein [Rickettsiales bacterium]